MLVYNAAWRVPRNMFPATPETPKIARRFPSSAGLSVECQLNLTASRFLYRDILVSMSEEAGHTPIEDERYETGPTCRFKYSKEEPEHVDRLGILSGEGPG